MLVGGGLLRCLHFLRVQRINARRCGKRKASIERGSAIDFEHFNFEDKFAARAFEIFDHCFRESDALRSVAHGEFVRADIERSFLNAAHFANRANRVCEFRFCGTLGQHKRAHDFGRVLRAFLQRIVGHEYRVAIQRNPECMRLKSQRRDGSIKISVGKLKADLNVGRSCSKSMMMPNCFASSA